MDLLDFKPTIDTIDVKLNHPGTGEPLGDKKSKMTITVYLPHSRVYKDALHEQTNKRIQKAQKKKGMSFTAEDVEFASLELQAKATKDWDILLGGENPKFSVAKAVELYRDFPWIVAQIDEAVEEATSFTKA